MLINTWQSGCSLLSIEAFNGRTGEFLGYPEYGSMLGGLSHNKGLSRSVQAQSLTQRSYARKIGFTCESSTSHDPLGALRSDIDRRERCEWRQG